MDVKNILTLLNTPNIGRKTVLYTFNYDLLIKNTVDLIDLLIEVKKDHPRVVIPTEDQLLKAEAVANEIIEKSDQQDIKIIPITHKTYPERYKSLEDAPILIYAKGNIKALNSSRSVAIVGTREPTEYGIRAGEILATNFASNKFVVVSGLALGCDTVAHKGCLKVHGTTVAVLAGGLDKIYPKENRDLASEILEKNGCLISEYPVGTSPRGNFFVERDRLQSGLSQAVIVIETDVKGGTMHTVGFALKQKRYLACLSDHPDKYKAHPKTQGNQLLIHEKKAQALGNFMEIQRFIHFLSQFDKKPKKKSSKKKGKKNDSIDDNSPQIFISY